MLISDGKADLTEKLDVMLCRCKDNSLFWRLDDVPKQMQQDGRLVIRTTLKKRQLHTSDINYNKAALSNSH